MAIKRKTLLVENTPAKAAAKAAVKKAAIKSAARDVSKGVENTPIEVSDPKDPRLKRYSDSLDVYNTGNRVKGEFMNYHNSLPKSSESKYKKIKLALDSDNKEKTTYNVANISEKDYRSKYAPLRDKYTSYVKKISEGDIKAIPNTNDRIGIRVNRANGAGKAGTGYLYDFKKPTQPIKLKKTTESVQNGVLKADTVQSKPRVKRPGERIVADNASGGGYPNVDNVYINNRLDSIQNQAGERLKYGTKFTREWQYRKKK
jgi:hypothetical protein